MKARLAKKILGCQWCNSTPYWWDRVWDAFDGRRRDHRVEEAARKRKTIELLNY